MSDYIPSTDPEKILWMLALTDWLETNGAAHGFTPAEITAFQTEVAAAQNALNAHIVAQDAARSATVAKNDAIGTAIATARDYAQKLQHDLSMTDAERAAAGLAVPDGSPSPSSAATVAEMEPPLLLLDFSIRHQVTIHWGPNPGNERQNAKPTGVMGCEIQYAQGALPQQQTGWISLGLDTASPMIHQVTETTPPTFFYRARYVDKKLNYGNFGDPAECTVSV